jgi:hypothetical protein
MQLLTDIVNNPDKYRRPIDIVAVKNTTNLLKHIPKLFARTPEQGTSI